jgi:antitoxin PrlF
MTISAKVTSKGQITLPASLRKELGLKPGDRVDFVPNAKGGYELQGNRKTMADLKGIIRYDGHSLSNDDIVEMVKAARTERGVAILHRLKGNGR